jgi:hypothetical protein
MRHHPQGVDDTSIEEGERTAAVQVVLLDLTSQDFLCKLRRRGPGAQPTGPARADDRARRVVDGGIAETVQLAQEGCLAGAWATCDGDTHGVTGVPTYGSFRGGFREA